MNQQPQQLNRNAPENSQANLKEEVSRKRVHAAVAVGDIDEINIADTIIEEEKAKVKLVKLYHPELFVYYIGPAGRNGRDGEEGPIGPRGPKGPKGSKGEDGVDGVDGDAGPRGLPGKDGEDGVSGEILQRIESRLDRMDESLENLKTFMDESIIKLKTFTEEISKKQFEELKKVSQKLDFAGRYLLSEEPK
ncbi:collagen alpha-1(XXV) chain [Acrasis kona]|uniref:Collagen alpha-1(XXV) chain n=1 Tax=Acrasis kona TaxID=1008807 RepID=A0AAW2ZT84_9EUKA